ncbi:DUF1801 domain-containing protein [Pedobacter sp. KR3-3]|uniref:DUF1801 domain-containing protein n=1 Tax=Pedobacter albus TaxID=3113905 RepID=A0ABU7I8L5_9SPHI|nr:DUF1801 domain-containing protein [Pedobacter sp. KR3-3]MEE1945815.1 DUF1801 domain-containing protein [Pedobacter sp. KR3-3]
MQHPIAQTIDEYIADFPPAVQELLQQVRATIAQAAPEATEAIKYAIPTFVFHGNLVHFAGYKNHIGFYATPGAHQDFAQELAPYKQGKGSVQFPIDQPMPLSLITRMVKYRMQKNLAKLAGKKK